jgi:spore maturation protein CgeB
VPEEGLGGFELVLSYTGGRAQDELREKLHARVAVPLYGSVDPDAHRPAPVDPSFASDLSYLGTFSADRQDRLERLFLTPARRSPTRRFALAGSQYPETFEWPANVFYFWHLIPSQHCAFYCSSGFTLNITRAPMAEMGFCPSGRLFEAAACGAAILSDAWDGLEEFFEPGREILTASTTEEALGALELSSDARRRIGDRARERALDCHTAEKRAAELEAIVERTGAGALALRPALEL